MCKLKNSREDAEPQRKVLLCGSASLREINAELLNCANFVR